MMELSIVTPVYQAEGCIEELYRRVVQQVSAITPNFEIVMVDDASFDHSWEAIKELAAKDDRVVGVRFSRNFGQHYAISAGLERATGTYVVIMDCDLQDPPEEIKRLYTEITNNDYDIVLARRIGRQDSITSRILSRFFYRVYSYLAKTKIDPTVGTFRILSKKVVSSFNSMPEHLRFFGGMVQWLGFKVGTIDVAHQQRHAGNSSYDIKRKLRLAIEGILSFSDRPLRLVVYSALILFLVSMIGASVLVYQVIFLDVGVPGWASTLVSLYFLGGLILLNLGIVGLYIGKIFGEIKSRPIYIVTEQVGDSK